jgi:DNA-binding transcriptional LysR family regulator
MIKQCELQTADQAKNHTLIDAHPDLPLFRYFLDTAPAEPAWRFSGVECLGAIAAVRQRILGGRGVGVLPEYFVRKDLKSGRLVQLMPEQQLKHDVFRMIWPAEHRRARQMPALARQLQALPLR